MSKRLYMSRDEREIVVFKSILSCAIDYGLYSFNFEDVADEVNCSESLIRSYFGSMKNVRKKLIQHAENNRIESILNAVIR